MDGSVSDFDDIFILFMKMEMKSYSRLGSKHQQKQFWGRSLHVSLKNTNIARIKFFCDQTSCCLADYGHGVNKV